MRRFWVPVRPLVAAFAYRAEYGISSGPQVGETISIHFTLSNMGV